MYLKISKVFDNLYSFFDGNRINSCVKIFDLSGFYMPVAGNATFHHRLASPVSNFVNPKDHIVMDVCTLPSPPAASPAGSMFLNPCLGLVFSLVQNGDLSSWSIAGPAKETYNWACTDDRLWF